MRVLLAEDDCRLATALTESLVLAGHGVDHVLDGEQALAALQTQPYALALLDRCLPRADGFDVLKKLRDGHNRIPVLIVSARDDLDDRLTGLNLGADDYLVRPFDPAELEARMRAVLRRTDGVGAARVALGRLRIDTGRREVRVDDAMLKLSPRDYSVLDVLAANAGRLVSRERIVGSVSSWDREFSEGALEVYVHRLRKLIAGSGVEIVTHRGFGYALHEIKAERP